MIRPLPVLLFSLVFLAALPVAAEWSHSGGTPLGSGHVAGSGAISSAAGELPGTTALVQAPATDFSVALFSDVNGDGQDEILRVFQERLGAFDLGNGEPLWLTPSMGISAIEGIADVDGDGEANEIVVTAVGMGGGIYVIDLTTGAVKGSFTDLVGNSGVRDDELVLADVDGDGADELVFVAALLFTPELYVVDMSTADGVHRVTHGDLGGYYLQLNRLVVGDFDGDGQAGEIVTLQADWLDLKRVCAASDAGAQCDGQDDTLCLCDVALVEDAFAARIFPQTPRALDADGDGADELVTVHRHGTHANGFGVVDLSSYFDGSTTPALGGWLYDYSALEDRPEPYEPEGVPRDLDGDGALDIVVTVIGAGVGELGLDGTQADDGLDNDEGFSVGVYSGAGGALLASLDEAIVHGYVDLDGDGTDELVVERTDEGVVSGGPTEGWELVCGTESCSLELAWSAPDHLVTRFATAWDETGRPPPIGLMRVVPEGPDQQGLLLWSSDVLQMVSWEGVGEATTVLGSLSLAAEDEISGVADMGDAVLVNREGLVTLYSAGLSPRAEFGDLPSGTVLSWFAAQLDASTPGAASFLDGHAFFELGPKTLLSEADVSLLEDVALIADIDGNGRADVIATELSEETGAVLVRRYEYEPASAVFVEHWTWQNIDTFGAEGLQPRTLWSFNHGDFNQDGTDDLVFSLEYWPDMGIFYLDGVTGDLLAASWLFMRDAQYAPIAVGDFCSQEGYGIPDGDLDVLRPSRLALESWAFGQAAPTASLGNSTQHAHFAFADDDADDRADRLVMGRLYAVVDPALEVVSLSPDLAVGWGPVSDLEPAPAVEQAMALASVDAAEGEDIVVISSSGALDVRAGSDGSRMAGFPVFLSEGELSTEAGPRTQPLRALIALDVDGDGHVEAVVGSSAGYVYAVDIAEADEDAPGLQWSWFGGGAPIAGLGAADVDGDGELEVLVSPADGSARVIDGLGVSIEITQPEADDCLETTEFAVCGTSSWIERVDVLVQGLPVAEGVEVLKDGSWCADVSVPAVVAEVEIVAVGWSGEVPAASDQIFLLSELDEDGDGVTVCGGDCDDENPDIAPGLPEACDGLDNDCDPSTDENEDSDGDGASACDGDCDDGDDRASPIGIEDCEDGIDNDCDGALDQDDEDCGVGVVAVGDDCCDSEGCSTALRWDPGQPWALPARSLLWVFAALLVLRRRQRD